MTERRDIGLRLENWANCIGGREHKPGISRLGRDLDRMRKDSEGSSSSCGNSRRIDRADADIIERAMRILDEKHRTMLYWCYIKGVAPEVVCRKMRIPHFPATDFVAAFRAAQGAIDVITQLNKIP